MNGCNTANPNYVAPTEATTQTNTVATTAQATTVATTQATTQATTAATAVQTTAAPTTVATIASVQATTQVAAPKSAKFKKAKGSKNAISLEWKKVNSVNGYEIQLATDKKFKKNKKSVTVGKQKTTKTTVKKLKAKKTYYVRIRTYKTVNGTKVYSDWSKAKSVKTK